MSESNKMNGQLTLFGVGGMVDQEITRVFGVKPKTNKNGAVVGHVFAVKGRKELAAEFNLKGKANKDSLDAAILQQQDAAFRLAKAHMSTLESKDGWTLQKHAAVTLANGDDQITTVIRRIKRFTGINPEAIAKALGLTTDQVKDMMAEAEAKAKAQNVDIEFAELSDKAESVDADAGLQTETPPMTDEELEKLTAPVNA